MLFALIKRLRETPGVRVREGFIEVGAFELGTEGSIWVFQMRKTDKGVLKHRETENGECDILGICSA